MVNEILEKNTACLNTLYPTLLQDLERYEREIEKRPDCNYVVELVKGRRGSDTFVMKTPDGRALHGNSLFDPLKEAEKRMSSLSFDKKERVVLLGFGFGYEVRYLLSRIEHPMIMVIEPSVKLFRLALESVDLTDIFETRKVLLTFALEASDLKYYITANASYMTLPDYAVRTIPHITLFPGIYDIIEKSIKESGNFMMMNMITVMQAGAVFQTNTAMNFRPALKNPGIPLLYNKFQGRPVFVIAPGPSLEKNVRMLRAVKGKALIIACDTAVRPLLRNGIEPDCIATIDFQPLNYFKLRGVDTSFAYLLPSIEVTPYIPLNHKGRMFNYFHSDTTERIFSPILGRKGIVATGGSVLTDAFSMACMFGADPVVLMGVDLGFPGNKWYADGSFRNEKYSDGIKDMNLIEIEDIYGDPMFTYASFYEFLTWFGLRVPNMQRKVIDATEGGAKIKGTIIKPVAEVIDEFLSETPERTPLEILDEAWESYQPPDYDVALETISRFIDDYRHISTELKRGHRDCSRVIDMLKRTRSVDNNKELIRLLHRINDAKEVLKETDKQGHLCFIAPMMERQFAAIHFFEGQEDNPETRGDRAGYIKSIVELDHEFYDRVIKACNNMTTVFEMIRGEMLLERDEEFV